jgi:hypothetical protein
MYIKRHKFFSQFTNLDNKKPFCAIRAIRKTSIFFFITRIHIIPINYFILKETKESFKLKRHCCT